MQLYSSYAIILLPTAGLFSPLYVFSPQMSSTPMNHHEALIQVKNLYYKVNNRSILQKINLDLYPQQIVTIIGPNGAGKSSLIKLLMGLLLPSSGQVVLKKNLRIGYVPQLFTRQNWMPLTALDFLKLYQVEPSVVDVRNDPLMGHLNLEKILNTPLNELSGGELQRLLIAQAILQQPHLLVLDEPLQGLDMSGQSKFYSLIQKLRQERGLSILLVSHDIHLVMAQTDLVLCLHQHICCIGKPEHIKKNQEFLKLFGSQLETHDLGFYSHHHNHTHDDW